MLTSKSKLAVISRPSCGTTVWLVPDPIDADRPRRWGSETALLDDGEARRRLVEATARCIVARGSTRITVQEVAKEAAVARSTVYRYFANRDDLLVGVLLTDMNPAIGHLVASLPRPDDAASSIVELVTRPLEIIDCNELIEAMFSEESGWLVMSLEASAEPIIDTFHRHLGPLLQRWQDDGQIHADLDLRETTRCINTVALLMLAPPWADRPDDAKRDFVGQYLVRALVVR